MENASSEDTVFRRALSKLLIELFDGPPGAEAYVLNPGDRGLLRELESISAQAASTPGASGKTSIASHADHVHFGLTLLNRWSRGESDPFAGADYGASWRRTTVSDEQWRRLRDDLRSEAEQWKSAVAERAAWDDVSAAGAIASAAHTAYHLGAMRQIIARGVHAG